MDINIFERLEKKYIIDESQYKLLIEKIKNKMVIDEHGFYTIYNIYFDTDNFDLIRKSLEHPIYKEKVRLRSYNIPNLESVVFLELKKKYKGTVYKRRTKIKLKDFYSYYYTKKLPFKTQIMKEIDYTFRFNNLKSQVFIAYDRCAYFYKKDNNFRITFDTNLRSRFDNLYLEKGDGGNIITNKYIMEVKTINSLPVWFTKILNELKIYPTSFSKYGEVYKNKLGGNKLCLNQF